MRYFINGQQVSETAACSHFLQCAEQMGMLGSEAHSYIWTVRGEEEVRDTIADMTGGAVEMRV
jgi:hypothetical protein